MIAVQDALLAVRPGMHYVHAPPGTAGLYTVFQFITNTVEKTFTDKSHDLLIQFTIFSDSSSAVEVNNERDALVAAFDGHVLNVSGYKAHCMQHENEFLTWVTEEAEGYWSYVIEFSLYLEKL